MRTYYISENKSVVYSFLLINLKIQILNKKRENLVKENISMNKSLIICFLFLSISASYVYADSFDLISSQLVEKKNWQIMKTYDQLNIDRNTAIPIIISILLLSDDNNGEARSNINSENIEVSSLDSSDSSHRLQSIKNMTTDNSTDEETNSFSALVNLYESQYLEDITNYTATGLVSEHLSWLYVDDEDLVVGNLLAGFSQIKIRDINNPQGKVSNYRGRDTGNASDRFGCSGFTKRSTDKRIYAWYGQDIVDVSKKEIVFSNAPDYTHSSYGCRPKERFTTDEEGNFWIGTSNVDINGKFEDDGTGFSNGLSKISSDFSERTVVVSDLAVWNIFKSKDGTIWIGGDKGIYKRSPGDLPNKIYDSTTTNYFPEQIFEHKDEIYAIIKNFFHNPYLVDNRSFDLFKWNNENSKFEKICNILNNTYSHSVYGFSYNGSLYVARGGSSDPYKFNEVSSSFTEVTSIGKDMGQYALSSFGAVLFSVGNINGVSIYNYNGDKETKKITSVNTAEALITDNIHSLYSASENRMFIGPEASGFNIFNNNQFEIHELPNEIVAVGFFEHEGHIYAQGASNLYRMEGDELDKFQRFSTNGEKIYYDGNGSGYLWTFPNWGAGYGGIAVLNLSTLEIKGTCDSSGNCDYWDTTEIWTQGKLGGSYHFHDIISIPGENAVFIAVGDSEINFPIQSMPYMLKYSYGSNNFTRIDLPDANSQGIRLFATNGTELYGIARQKLYIFRDGQWDYFSDIKLGNDFRGVKILEDWMVIISGWNTSGDGLSGGVEVVNLKDKSSVHFDSSDIPIPTNAVFAIEIQDLGDNHFRLWFGTYNGLAYCDLDLTN